ncbi:MAG: hypothetical protein WC329_01515 [Candidatus Omnitrophota bacterium]|jgi:hypothetical protein
MKTEFKCPSGHTVKATDLHSTVILAEADIEKAVVFECPCGKRGHTFTLKKAKDAGMFTVEEASRIAEGGRIHQAKYGGKAAM